MEQHRWFQKNQNSPSPKTEIMTTQQKLLPDREVLIQHIGDKRDDKPLEANIILFRIILYKLPGACRAAALCTSLTWRADEGPSGKEMPGLLPALALLEPVPFCNTG